MYYIELNRKLEDEIKDGGLSVNTAIGAIRQLINSIGCTAFEYMDRKDEELMLKCLDRIIEEINNV